MLVVQKYGGSSVATPELIKKVALRIKRTRAEGNRVVVVVSAMGNMTDHLIRLAGRTVAHPPQRELDMLLTAGERVSMSLLAMALHAEGIPAISFTGSQSGIVTTNEHTEARILEIRCHRIQEALDKEKVVIVAGFQGVSLEKEITTLGRGGSDTTAVALAAALNADVCEILTDVDGLFSADPRIVANADLISSCNYDVALELASWGAKMHPRSLEIARRYGVCLRVGSAHGDSQCGTWIKRSARQHSEGTAMENPHVVGVTVKEGFHYFRCSGTAGEFFGWLGDLKSHIRLFQFASDEVSFLVDKGQASALKDLLKGKTQVLEEHAEVAVLAAVGDGFSCASELLPQFLSALRRCDTSCWIVTANSLSVCAAIPAANKSSALQSVHLVLVEQKKRAPLEGSSLIVEAVSEINRTPPPY